MSEKITLRERITLKILLVAAQMFAPTSEMRTAIEELSRYAIYAGQECER